MSEFDDVGAFHEKFGLPVAGDGPPRLVDAETARFKVAHLEEEMDELRAGYEAGDLAQIADALVDLVYVAKNVAHFHRLPWPDLWDAVQRANMAKERAATAADSKRGSRLDVVKPAGWRPPDVAGILMAHGWLGPRLPFGDGPEDRRETA